MMTSCKHVFRWLGVVAMLAGAAVPALAAPHDDAYHPPAGAVPTIPNATLKLGSYASGNGIAVRSYPADAGAAAAEVSPPTLVPPAPSVAPDAPASPASNASASSIYPDVSDADIDDADALPMPRTVNGLTFITGGIGEAERRDLEARRRDYNVHIINAEAGGSYIGGVVLKIMDASGAVLLHTEADPLFFIQLPAGKYQIDARFEGRHVTKSVVVGASLLPDITLRW